MPIPSVTTCNAAPVTWQQYLDSETRIMFGHLTGNDPRPHYFHQTNIAQANPNAPTTDTSVGGTLYAVIDSLLGRYDAVFDRGSAPLIQLSQQQIADTLAQQDGWAATKATTAVSAWLQDGRIHIANSGPGTVAVPVTGTTAGTAYAGQKSGWISLAAGSRAGARSQRSGEGDGGRGLRDGEGRPEAHGHRRHVDRDAGDPPAVPLAAL